MPIATVSVHELAAILTADPSTPLIDVRELDEFNQVHVPSAVHIPLQTVPLRHLELSTDRTVYVICAVGGRSAQACAWLDQQGYDVVNVEGGTRDWVAAGLPTG